MLKVWSVPSILLLTVIIAITPAKSKALPFSTSTLLSDISDPSQANIVFSSVGGGLVDVSYSGAFDFSPIGGSLEPFSWSVVVDSAIAPIPSGDPSIVNYDLPLSSFSIFGRSFAPIGAGILLQDGTGTIGDFFTLQISLDFNNSSGIPIPGASLGLIALGVNAGAFPPDLFAGIAFPTDVNIFEDSTGSNQFAVVNSPAAVPLPATLYLLFFGIGSLFITKRRRSKPA